MSNLLTDNIYFDCQTYNNTSSNILAQSDDDLSFDILSKTGDYNVCITKAQIPLDSIPLTKSNIPLKQYQVTMSQGGFTESAYVRQYNASQDNFLYVANDVSQNVATYKYSSTTVVPQGTTDLSSIVSVIFNIAYDDYLNIYVIGNNDGSYVPKSLFIIDSNNQLITQMDFTFIKAFFIDRGQNVYIGDDAEDGSVVNIYSNVNGLNAVSLTEVAQLTTDFAGDILHNLNSVCADTLYVIVFHDSNIATFYNPSTYVAISDVTLTGVTGAVKTSNMMQDDGTFIIVDDSGVSDNLYGQRSNTCFEITNGDLQITTEGDFDNKLCVIGSYAFLEDTGETSFVPYPFDSPPTVPNSINSSAITALACGNNTLYSIQSSGYILQSWNQQGVVNNQWTETSNTFTVQGTPSGTFITDFDVNVFTNKLFSVSDDNKLYVSNNPFRPNEIYSITNDTITRYGFDILEPLAPFTVIDTYELANVSQILRVGAEYYTLVNNPGSFSLTNRNTTDFSVNTTFPCSELTGIDKIQVGNCLIVAGTEANQAVLRYYDTTTGALLTGLNTFDTYIDMCLLPNNYLIYVSDGNQLNIINVTFPDPLVGQTFFVPPGGTISKITSNAADLLNGIATIFIAYELDGEYKIDLIRFAANFVSIAQQETIYTSANPISHMGCSSGTGQLTFYDSENNGFILFQASSYETIFNIPSLAMNDLYVPNNIDHTIFHTQIQIGSFSIQSVAVSRSSPHTLYAINSSDLLLYYGTYLSGEPVNFQRLNSYDGTYEYISCSKSTTQDIYDSTLRLYSLSNQNLINSQAFNNTTINSIARNDNNNEYLVPIKNSNVVRSYNSLNLTLNYTFGVLKPEFIFAKFGEDITAGPFDIYYMQVLIEAINEALLRCSTRLKAKGATINPTSQVISLDYLSQLLTLKYDPKFAVSPAFIRFNPQLLTICNFINSGGNLILDPSGSVTQNQKSIFRFNSLTGGKIKFATTTLFVNGNYYGKVTRQQTQNTSSNRIITDLDVPTDTFIDNIGQILYYQPNGTLRPYTMYSNLPLRKVTLQVVYEYRDLQDEYSLYLLPDQNFTVKLNFIKKY